MREQLLARQPVGEGHAGHADKSRGQAHGDQRLSDQADQAGAQVKVAHLLARVGTDKDRPRALCDLVGQDGVGGLVVMRAEGRVSEVVDAKEKGD